MNDFLAHLSRLPAVAACWVLAALVGFAFAAAAPRSWRRTIDRPVRRLARTTGRWLPAWATLLALLISLPLIVGREPQPRVHDEFSYLLAGDTFARGRLTNPTPIGWPAFETMHVLVRPSYASKYPPGQGLLLALGQWISHRPVVGAWLGAGIACGAIAWMLRARLSQHWALLGSLLAALHPHVLYWAQSFWGGQIAMTGGALLLGACLRMIRLGRPTWRLSSIAACGVALLAVSRPSEGAIFSLAVAGWTLYAWRRQAERHGNGPTVREIALRALVPAGCVLIPLFGWLAYYNVRVTGSPAVPPYIEHIRQYGVASPFLFQSLRPEPIFRNPELRGLQAEWEVDAWRRQQSLPGYLHGALGKIYSPVRDAVLPGAMPLLIAASFLGIRRDRSTRRAAVAVIGYCLLVASIQTWTMVHYIAAAAPLVFFLAVMGYRHLRRLSRHSRAGRWLVSTALAAVVVFALRYHLLARRDYGWQHDRHTLIKQLESRGGRHLIVVRYSPTHDMMREWVANSAEIDEQKVVFSREVDPETMGTVVSHFQARGRSIWLLEPDRDFFRLVPYRLRSDDGANESF